MKARAVSLAQLHPNFLVAADMSPSPAPDMGVGQQIELRAVGAERHHQRHGSAIPAKAARFDTLVLCPAGSRAQRHIGYPQS